MLNNNLDMVIIPEIAYLLLVVFGLGIWAVLV